MMMKVRIIALIPFIGLPVYRQRAGAGTIENDSAVVAATAAVPAASAAMMAAACAAMMAASAAIAAAAMVTVARGT